MLKLHTLRAVRRLVEDVPHDEVTEQVPCVVASCIFIPCREAFETKIDTAHKYPHGTEQQKCKVIRAAIVPDGVRKGTMRSAGAEYL